MEENKFVYDSTQQVDGAEICVVDGDGSMRTVMLGNRMTAVMQ